MERLVCLAVGYLFGIFQTGYIYGRVHGIDIRKYGSGNSGSTNALRVMGKKAGLTVFLGDFLKTVIPCMAVRFVFKDQPDYAYVYMLYIGLGVILGHNYPFYLHFKGGKGIASMAGILVSMDWRVTLVCASLFLGAVILTRYVSLGSILVVTAFFIQMVFFGLRGDYAVAEGDRMEFFAVAGVLMVMAIWRHRANIRRLLKGTENKLWGNKEK